MADSTKIQMTTPLVEMDGDEMTRILWKMIKDELLIPYIDLKTEYYDLGLEHRNETDDKVTVESAQATRKYGVAVKCATITPNAARVEEYHLKEMWKSPNGTIRAILDGTVFRTPIIVKGIEPNVKTWEKPITLARHAYGDVYKNVEIKVPGAGKGYLVFEDENGKMMYICSVYFDQAFVGRRGDGGIYKDITHKWVVCYVQVDDVLDEKTGETYPEYMVKLGDVHVGSCRQPTFRNHL